MGVLADDLVLDDVARDEVVAREEGVDPRRPVSAGVVALGRDVLAARGVGVFADEAVAHDDGVDVVVAAAPVGVRLRAARGLAGVEALAVDADLVAGLDHAVLGDLGRAPHGGAVENELFEGVDMQGVELGLCDLGALQLLDELGVARLHQALGVGVSGLGLEVLDAYDPDDALEARGSGHGGRRRSRVVAALLALLEERANVPCLLRDVDGDGVVEDGYELDIEQIPGREIPVRRNIIAKLRGDGAAIYGARGIGGLSRRRIVVDNDHIGGWRR